MRPAWAHQEDGVQRSISLARGCLTGLACVWGPLGGTSGKRWAALVSSCMRQRTAPQDLLVFVGFGQKVRRLGGQYRVSVYTRATALSRPRDLVHSILGAVAAGGPGGRRLTRRAGEVQPATCLLATVQRVCDVDLRPSAPVSCPTYAPTGSPNSPSSSSSELSAFRASIS